MVKLIHSRYFSNTNLFLKKFICVLFVLGLMFPVTTQAQGKLCTYVRTTVTQVGYDYWCGDGACYATGIFCCDNPPAELGCLPNIVEFATGGPGGGIDPRYHLEMRTIGPAGNSGWTAPQIYQLNDRGGSGCGNQGYTATYNNPDFSVQINNACVTSVDVYHNFWEEDACGSQTTFSEACVFFYDDDYQLTGTNTGHAVTTWANGSANYYLDRGIYEWWYTVSWNIANAPSVNATTISLAACNSGTVTVTSGLDAAGDFVLATSLWDYNSIVSRREANGDLTIPANSTFPRTYYVYEINDNATSSANWCRGDYTTITVVESPIPTIVSSGTTSICAGSTATLSATITNASGCTIQWERWNGSAWVDISGANGTTYTTPTLSANNFYQATLECTGGCGTIIAPYETVTVVPAPSISASSSATICSGTTATLTSTASNALGTCTYQWYEWNGSGYSAIPGATGATYTTPALTSTSIYYNTISCVGNGCPTAASNNVTISIATDPTTPTVTPSPNAASVCEGQTLTVTSPSSSGGLGTCGFEYRYSTDGGSSYTSWSSTVPSFAATGTDNRIETRVTCSAANCNLSGVNTTIWTVSPDPTVSISGGGSICSGASILLSATANDGTGTCGYQWQVANAIGGPYTNISGATGSTYNASPTATRYYRVQYSCSGNGCNVATSNVEMVDVSPVPSITASGGTTICGSGSAVLTASPSGGSGTCTLQWYSSTDNITFTAIGGATNTTYTTPVISSRTYYRVQNICTGTGCATATSNSVAVSVSANSTGAITDTICANEMYTLPSGAVVLGAGVYTDVIPNSVACDSTITVTLVTPPSAAHYGLYAASATDYYQLNPLTGAIINTYSASANSLGWVNGAFTIHEQAAKLYWISDLLELQSLDLTSGVQNSVASGISSLPFFWGLRYYNGWLYTITNSGDNDKMLVRINPTTGAIDAGFPGIEINGSAAYDILVHESMVINPLNGVLYIPLYGNVMLAFDIAAGTGNIVNLSGYVSPGGFIGLLEINENTGEMFALSGFSDIVSINVTGPTTATVALVKTLTSGSGFSNPISAFDSDNELYIFQAQSGCAANNPLITLDVNTGIEYCTDPPGVAFLQMEFLNCTPPSSFREVETFGVNLYPNPVKDALKLEVDLTMDDDVVVRIFNVSGALQMEKQLSGESGYNLIDLDVSSLTPGLHIVHVSSGKKQYTGKIVKL